MQNTRLNSLVDGGLQRLGRWLQNPWRRISLVIISLLFGNFLATAIATTTGQQADLDILVATILVGFTEAVSWVVYRRGRSQTRPTNGTEQQALPVEMLNALKLGLIYGMFVEALKIGS